MQRQLFSIGLADIVFEQSFKTEIHSSYYRRYCISASRISARTHPISVSHAGIGLCSHRGNFNLNLDVYNSLFFSWAFLKDSWFTVLCYYNKQQSDSVMHMCVYIYIYIYIQSFLIYFSIMFHYKILNIILFAT